MKLSRKNITMQVLSKFIENNLEKIENVETKANQITFKTIEGVKKVKIKTSKDYSEGEDSNTYLWTSFSSKELEYQNIKTKIRVDNLTESNESEVFLDRKMEMRYFQDSQNRKGEYVMDMFLYTLICKKYIIII